MECPGTQVVIKGSCLTAATAVSFNGTPANGYTVNSDSQITATVANSTTTGTVSVTGPSDAGTSKKPFTVTP